MGETTGGVLRRDSDRIIAGVCSGLGRYFGVEPLLVRVVFVILTLVGAGIGIILYLVLWFLMDPPAAEPIVPTRNVGDRLRSMGQEIREEFRTGFSQPPERGPQTGSPGGPPVAGPTGSRPAWTGWAGRPRAVWIGVILIALGGYLLIANLGLLRGFRGDIFWPIVLIAIGLLVLVRRK
ncbi:MAG: PspC domain-containing protein [Chloroflexi bacterium]|nr:MAG: PspC domain-containing protein [Chloroflexota bacterium]